MLAQHSAKLDVLLLLLLRSRWSQIFNRMGFSWLLCCFQRSTAILSQVIGASKAKPIQVSFCLECIPLTLQSTRFQKVCEQLHLGRWKLACLQAGFQEHVALLAKGDQNEVGELQKLDRSSCVSPLWNVALQDWKTAQTNQGRFLPTFTHVVNKSCQPCKEGQAGFLLECIPLALQSTRCQEACQTRCQKVCEQLHQFRKTKSSVAGRQVCRNL